MDISTSVIYLNSSYINFDLWHNFLQIKVILAR